MSSSLPMEMVRALAEDASRLVPTLADAATTVGGEQVWTEIQNFLDSLDGRQTLDAFRHYLDGTGDDFELDLSSIILDDNVIAAALTGEQAQLVAAAQTLFAGTTIQFHRISSLEVGVSATTSGFGALTQQVLWASGSVSLDPATCAIDIDFTIQSLDFYNPDNAVADAISKIMGRLAVLGWAEPFFVTGEVSIDESIVFVVCPFPQLP